MYTMILRFAGPLQSWGTDARFETRLTEDIPTKSGIIGLLASALGRQRDESIEDLRKLSYGVRVERPGKQIKDFHTARKVEGKKETSYITTRFYLSDAAFIVGVSGEDKEFLEQLGDAIRHPAYPLFLGRRSCTPDLPIYREIVEMPLLEALISYNCSDETGNQIKIFIEGVYPNGIVRRVLDEPETFDQKHRKYKPRTVTEITVSKGEAPITPEEFDAMEAWNDSTD